jgi:hypothetical protein
MQNSFHFALTRFSFSDWIIQLKKNGLVVSFLFFAMVFSLEANNQNKLSPRFEDYPAKEIYQGTIARPIFDTSQKREFSSQIINGVEKGDSVFRDYKDQKGPNFAGHMIIIRWGCGSPCLRMALVDARNGKVFFPPQINYDTPTPSFDLPLLLLGRSVPQNPELEFRLDSNLMIIKATPNSQIQNQSAFTYFFLWIQNRWKLFKKVQIKNPPE